MHPAPQDPRHDPRHQGPPAPRPGSSSDHRPRYPDPRLGSGVDHGRAGDPRAASGSDALRRLQQQGLRPGSASDHLRPGVDPRLIPSGADHGRNLHASGQDLREAAPPGAPGLVGRRVGPYRITALIAQGGMGTVYEAMHERLQRAVALKTLLPGGDASSEDVQRFLNEARAAARLSHRNIVPIHDVGEANGVRYLAMELVRGETLHGLVRRAGPLEERRALEVLAEAADGLEHAHRSGIVHRDLKPANILLDGDGTPRVTDFGVAKARGNQRLTATGTALGTPSYMSPEQAMGHNETLDARSDVYGLGAILYECLTGRPPFDLGSHMQTMQAVVSDPPTPPSEHRAGLSPEVEAICLKCLAKKPEARYGSCRELADDLRRCLAGRTVAARPPGRLGLVLRRLRRLAGAMTLAAALAAVLLAGLAAAAPGWLAARRLVELERQATALLGARLARAEAALTAPTVDGLRPLVEGLAPAALRQEALEALAPGGEVERLAAVERGLAPDELARGSALQARALLRLAAAAAAPGERDALLARAELVDPDGAAGRAARVVTAAALAQVAEPAAREQALEELTALARTLDPAGRRAAAALVQALADRGRWDAVLAHARRLRAAPRGGAGALDELTALDPALEPWMLGPGLARLEELAAVLVPALPLPAVDHLTVARGPAGPVVVLAQGPALWTRRLLPGDAPAVLARPADGVRLVDGDVHLAHVVPFDRDGDGHDELFLVTPQGHIGVGRLSGGGARWIEWGARSTEAPNGVAAGDVDGDGCDDVALTFWENASGSLLAMGAGAGAGERRAPFVPLFPSGGGERRYSISSVALADLDGDGRDEVVLGGSQFSQEVEVLAWDRDGGALVSRARLPLGVVRQLVPYPLDGSREGLLVVVDAARDDARRDLEADADAPWRGRDGLYLLEAAAGPSSLEVVARWTYGPDEPPSAASRTLAGEVQGLVLSVGGRPHVGRAAHVEGRGWCLELAPREALGLRANAAPALAMTGAPPPTPRRLFAANLDPDGTPAVFLGAHLLGLGEPRTPGDPYADLPAPTPEPAPAALLRVSRKLVALGHVDAARELVARLRAEHPTSWAASAGALLLTDPLLTSARRATDEARRAFARLEADVGARRREEARAAWAAAASASAALAASGEVAPRDALAAWERAAHAFEQAGDRAGSAHALARALDLTGLEQEVTARLRARLEALNRLDALQRLDLDPQQPEVRAALLVSDPLRCAVAGPALTLRCAPDSDEWALVPVELSAALPLVLETTLRLHGHGWATHVEVGLFEPRLGALEPERLTGVRVSLWDVSTRKPAARVWASGQAVGGLVRLSDFEGALTCRLELTSQERGGARVRLHLSDAEGRVLLVEDATVDGLPGPVVLAGIRSPVHGTSDGVVEQALWAMESRVTLERLRLEGARPRLVPSSGGVQAAHAALALDDPAGARALYDHLIARSASPEALFHRGLARGRLGDPAAHEDIVEAARRAPYHTILWLEDLAELLPDAHPGYTTAIGAALHALAASPRPLPKALGYHLLGNVDVILERLGDDPGATADAGAEAEVQEAAIYLNMRCAHNPQRWRQYPTYLRLVPGGRYPRKGLPRIIPAPPSGSVGASAELLATIAMRGPGCLHEQHRLAAQARLTGAPTPEQATIDLATFLANAGAHGMAEGLTRDLLARSDLSPQDEAGALVLQARSHAAQGREDLVSQAFQRLRALGAYTDAQVAEYERTIRKQVGVVGPVLQDGHRGR